MAIDSIESALLQNDALAEFLRALQENEKNIVDATASELSALSAPLAEDTVSLSRRAASYGSNMMSRNFADSGSDESRYLKAHTEAFQASQKMSISKDSSMVALLDMFGGITGPSAYDPHSNKKGGGASEHAIRKAIRQMVERDLVEKAQEEFERKREAERRKENEMEGAVLPTDGDGLPVQDASADLPLENESLPVVTEAPVIDAGEAQAPLPDVAQSEAIDANPNGEIRSVDLKI